MKPRVLYLGVLKQVKQVCTGYIPEPDTASLTDVVDHSVCVVNRAAENLDDYLRLEPRKRHVENTLNVRFLEDYKLLADLKNDLIDSVTLLVQAFASSMRNVIEVDQRDIGWKLSNGKVRDAAIAEITNYRSIKQGSYFFIKFRKLAKCVLCIVYEVNKIASDKQKLFFDYTGIIDDFAIRREQYNG